MEIKWDSFTFSLKQDNEDICYADGNMAWVLDGASGLYKENISEYASDAAWFVRQLDRYLKQRILENRPICDIIQNALIEIKHRYKQYPGADQIQDYPSCAAAILRRIGNELEYYVMADCELLVKHKDGRIQIISDQRIAPFDEKAIQSAVAMAHKTHTSMRECKKYMLPVEIENRKLKNKPSGYFALSDDDTICKEGLSDKISLLDIDSICLCSDGFAQYYETMKVVNTASEFFHDLETLALPIMHERMYIKQRNDADLNRFPRFKLTDDNTIVYGIIKKDL